MTKQLLFLFALLAPLLSFCQWTQQISGTTEDLFSVWPITSDKVVACGTNGTILITNDGGNNWSSAIANTSETLRKVFFANASIGYAVGNNGTIVKTTDGGNTWVTQTSGTTSMLASVYFVDTDTGYACGQSGTVRITTNGGASWQNYNTGGAEFLTDLRFWGDGSVNGIGFVCGSDGLLQRRNPNTWQSPVNVGGATVHYAMSLTEAGQFRLVGEGGNIYYGNGANFTLANSGVTEDLRAVHFLNPVYGHVAGHNGTILRTIDACETWLIQTSNTTEDLLGIRFSHPDTGYAVGANGTILKTTNSGGPACPTSSFNATASSINEYGFITFTATTIGSNNYEWLENGVPFDTSYSVSRSFPNPGSYDICLVVDNGECKDTSCQVITVNATGAEELENNKTFTVYPTVFSNELNFEFHSVGNMPYTLSLFSVAGKLIQSITINSNKGINRFTITSPIANLPKGVYFIYLAPENKTTGLPVKVIKH